MAVAAVARKHHEGDGAPDRLPDLVAQVEPGLVSLDELLGMALDDDRRPQ
jgi:hypothetical protein